MASRGTSSIALGAVSVLAAAALTLQARARAAQADRAFFAGKNVVITGGSRGLGFILTRMLLEAGATVTFCGRSPGSIDVALRTFARFGSAVAGEPCDVRDRAACGRLIDAAELRFGPVDILINNAGIIDVGPFADTTLDDFRAALDTHFWAPLYTMLAVLPSMRARRAGRIVNVASIGGIVGVPHLAPYSASKFAQIGLTQTLAAECAADSIIITSVVPGLMRTGSPDNATFKGRNRAEYAWFTLADANPLLSISVESAARRIIRATRRGEAQAVLGPTAQAAKVLNALLPETTARLLAFAAALLPAPGGSGIRRSGVQSRSAWTQNILTIFNRRAMRKTNEEHAAGERTAAQPTDANEP